MHVIHGTWIPNDAHKFVQSGAFYLWVETDTPTDTSRRRADAVHPRHLAHTALATFLMEKLGLREPLSGALARTLYTKYFLLPTAAGKPSPSFELLRYVDEEPVEFDLAPWQVSCYQVSDIVTALNDIHFIALHAAEDFCRSLLPAGICPGPRSFCDVRVAGIVQRRLACRTGPLAAGTDLILRAEVR